MKSKTMSRRTRVRAAASLAAVVCALAAHAPEAGAHGRGWVRGPRVGVYIGPPVIGGFYGYYGAPLLRAPVYGYPYVASPPVTVIQPPVYVQQAPASATATGEYWYWCADRQAYYPTVTECAGGWTVVPGR